MRRRSYWPLALAALLLGCAEGAPQEGPSGQLRLTLTTAPADVSGVQYDITCAGGQSVSAYVSLEEEGLPHHVAPMYVGAPFSDYFAVLPVGFCQVTATPMQAPGVISEECAPAEGDAFVTAEETTEILLVIPCDAPDVGALDVVSTFNHKPTFEQLTLSPGDTVAPCEPLSIDVKATDYDQQPVAITISVEPPSPEAWYSMAQLKTGYFFTAGAPGIWTLTIAASDGTSSSEVEQLITVTEGEAPCAAP